MKALNIIVLLAGLFAAVNSYAAGTVLMEKHGAAWPQSQNGYATKYRCMKCHGDYKNLAQKTKDFSPNPHYSHMGEVNRVECHKPNQAKPDLMCNSCHKFEIKKITK